MKINKHITDLTKQEVEKFLKDLDDSNEIIEFSIDKKLDVIYCKISFTYFISLKDKTTRKDQSLILSNPYYWEDSEESLYYIYGEETLEKWKQFCFAKGIYPDWMINNPYTKTHILQLTNEQIKLIRASLFSTRNQILFSKGPYNEDLEKIRNIHNYLKQFEDKNL